MEGIVTGNGVDVGDAVGIGLDVGVGEGETVTVGVGEGTPESRLHIFKLSNRASIVILAPTLLCTQNVNPDFSKS